MASEKKAPKKPLFEGETHLRFESAATWGAWLKDNHATAAPVWIVIAKKHAGIASVDYPGALDEALCWGWIDGQKQTYDDKYYRQRFSRRVVRSPWSKVNVAKCEGLIASGRMQTPGQAEIDRAKADGRWARAYDPPSKVTVPDDLQAALDASPKAAASFAGLNAQNRYAVLYRLHGAVKPETRAKRLAEFMAMLERGETVHPVAPKKAPR